ncbi:hypothetical protein BpHYR1_021259 [Brachionus plicatilis]|uniref:Uncharacterized protein n=1 Tax=Brachionus plicatilis TaxID=10195 RepID=A0A3M7SC97_BRAPC|nr:hypothetical protein BpHYR1_021259 [Brachionus plicatilis]
MSFFQSALFHYGDQAHPFGQHSHPMECICRTIHLPVLTPIFAPQLDLACCTANKYHSFPRIRFQCTVFSLSLELNSYEFLSEFFLSHNFDN